MFMYTSIEDIMNAVSIFWWFCDENEFKGYSYVTDEDLTLVCEDLVLNIVDGQTGWVIGEEIDG